MSRKDRALELFGNGFNCSQAVLSVFADEIGLDSEMALKISTGFGGGVRRGEVCGAVSGAIMVLGMVSGHYVEGDNEAKSKAYATANKFIGKFEEVNGSIICKELLKYDLSKEEDYKVLVDKGIFKDECPKLIAKSIEILESMI